jgi:PhnB protein
MSKVKPIPKGYHTVTPYLLVKGAAKLIELLKKAFGAMVVDCLKMSGGAIAHASLKIGNSMVMMGEAHGKWKPMPTMIYLYVKDVDATYRRALRAGAKSIMKPHNQFWGDRYGSVKDAHGNQWWIATHIENVSPAEIKRRMSG